jgi:4-amino-4-deoxy-L-arabinose transferase-like glycosyltransferase
VPRYQGQPFFDKPALTYWLIAASFQLFGFSTTAARLVPMLAALGVVLATVWVGTILLGRRVALAGGWMLTTTFGFMIFARVAMSDMLLTLWSTLAFGLAVTLFRRPAPAWALPVLGAVLGLGFLTKGPVALLLPGLGMLLLAWKRPWPALTPRGVVMAAALFAILGLGWFVAVWQRLGTAPLAHFFLRENLERFAGETYDSGRSPWFYLAIYLGEGGPWSLFLPAVLASYARRGREEGEGAGSVGLLLGWIGLMLVPLSLSRGKIDYYVLPLYPAACLVIAHHFIARSWGRLERNWARAALIVTASALALIPIVALKLPQAWLGRGALAGLATVTFSSALLLAATAVGPAPLRALVALATSSAAAFLAVVTLAVPAFVSAQPNAAIVADVLKEQAHRPDLSVALCSDPVRVQRDLLFRARLTPLERCDLWAPASSDRPFLLILQRNERDSLRSLPTFRMVSGYDSLPSSMINMEKILSPPEPQPLFVVANFPSRDAAVLERQRLRRERMERRQERPQATTPGRVFGRP